MPNRSSNDPEDVNSLAASIVSKATDSEIGPVGRKLREVLKQYGTGTLPEGVLPAAPDTQPEKNPAAVELGRKGGLKGGKARAESLTPEQRAEIAKAAAAARWKK